MQQKISMNNHVKNLPESVQRGMSRKGCKRVCESAMRKGARGSDVETPDDDVVGIPDDAIAVIADRVVELLRSLGKSKTLMLYLLEPYTTAIGAPNEVGLEQRIYDMVYDWVEHEMPRDGNSDYTFVKLYEKVKNGEL